MAARPPEDPDETMKRLASLETEVDKFHQEVGELDRKTGKLRHAMEVLYAVIADVPRSLIRLRRERM